MEQGGDWPAGLAVRIGQRVAHFRERVTGADGRPVRMTAQMLADRCAELGHPLDRSVIAKLEKGHRQTVTVAEVLVLAKALGVPPILLIYPIGSEPTTETLPGEERPTWAAAKWFTGSAAFPRPNIVGEPGPDVGTIEDNEKHRRGAAPVWLHIEHDRALRDLRWENGKLLMLRKAGASEDDLADAQKRVRDIEQHLADIRQDMRRQAIEPPQLAEHLLHIDEPPS